MYKGMDGWMNEGMHGWMIVRMHGWKGRRKCILIGGLNPSPSLEAEFKVSCGQLFSLGGSCGNTPGSEVALS